VIGHFKDVRTVADVGAQGVEHLWPIAHACGVDYPFATATSICLSIVTICSGLYLSCDIFCFPPSVKFSLTSGGSKNAGEVRSTATREML
jgi:hypothetical protein